MAGKRIRKGVSLGFDTVATLEALVAAGEAETLSGAIDLVVSEYRRRHVDADIIAAASGLGTDAEADMPGVVGSDAPSPAWQALEP